jgi:hypothetical protein
MVKTSKPKKCHKKSEKRGRISKKIKFIRHPNKTQDLKPESPRSISTKENTIINPENNAQIEYSLLNWSIIFLQQISCPLRNNKEFIQNFINIIKNLCINKNEFISWALYIEYFFSQSCGKISWDLNTFLYIGIYTKTIFNNNTFNDYGIIINNEKMSEINSILDKKIINLIEFNQTFNFYNDFTQKNKNTFFDFNNMVEYIYNSNHYKNVKKEKVDKKEKEKEKNDSQYSINNAMISVHPDEIIVKREDDIYQDNNIALFNCDDLYRYDNENLPEGDPFLKLDSSYDNLNMNVEEFFYFTHK